MVMLPRDISEGAAERRSLLADLLAAIAIALLVIALTAGLGVVAIIAIPTLLVLAAWIGVEAVLRRLRGSDR
jgi:hypothetical protein